MEGVCVRTELRVSGPAVVLNRGRFQDRVPRTNPETRPPPVPGPVLPGIYPRPGYYKPLMGKTVNVLGSVKDNVLFPVGLSKYL